MLKQNKPLSELSKIMESYPQVLKNVRTSKKIPLESIPDLQKKVIVLEGKLRDKGRILVRPSGTEPVIRVMVEGEDETVINTMADELCEVICKADRD
jgi:phosphoglucosamine mutase